MRLYRVTIENVGPHTYYVVAKTFDEAASKAIKSALKDGMERPRATAIYRLENFVR